MIRQLDLEHQSLVVQVEPTLIRVRECTSIHVSILGDEVVVTETKDEPLIIVTRNCRYCLGEGRPSRTPVSVVGDDQRLQLT